MTSEVTRHDPAQERLARLERDAEVDGVHYGDCDRFETYYHGTRQGTCDCLAEDEVKAVLRFARDVLAARDMYHADATAMSGAIGDAAVNRRLAGTKDD